MTYALTIRCNNYCLRNAALQQEVPGSILNFTRKLIALRKENPALRRGDFVPLTLAPRDALIYLRRTDEQTVLVALNFSRRLVGTLYATPLLQTNDWRLLFSTARDDLPRISADGIELVPYEVCLLVTP